MSRVLLDTSVYGRLVSDETTLQNLGREQKIHNLIIYGTRVIRQEIRKTPKNITFEGRKLRILLLRIYDALVRKDNHDLAYNKLIETLSKDYFKEYKKEGGSLSTQEMNNDQRSMFSKSAIRAYKKINKEYGMKNPVFKTYTNFKIELSRRSFQYGI